MPGPVVDRDILGEQTLAVDKKMRRHLQTRKVGKAMGTIGGQPVHEKGVHPGAAEVSGRQADAMNNNQLRATALRSRIMVRAVAPTAAQIRAAVEPSLVAKAGG